MVELIVPEERPSLEGELVENWRLERLLGEGGMSVVYLGRHQWLNQEAAIKLLRPEFCRDAGVLQRFQQEALAASKLEHENIIKVRNFGRDATHGYFMALELLHGVELDDIIAHAPLPKSWILGIVHQVCSALHQTHQEHIVHRDLKPSNIFLLPAHPIPKVKLLDFGVAKVQFESTAQKLTSTGVIIGTPAYLAPEQVVPRGELTPSADIYALGVVLYQMFTGQLPLFAETAIEHVINVLQVRPPLAGTIRPELAGTAVEQFLARMLEKSADDRPVSMHAVWEELCAATESFNDPLDTPEQLQTIEAYVAQATPQKKPQKSFEASPFETQAQELNRHREQALPTGISAPDTGSRQDTQPTLMPPSSGTVGPFTKREWLWLLLGIIVLGTAGGTGALWYLRQSTKISPKQNKRRTIAKLPKRSELEELILGGRELFKQKKVDAALRSWRRASRLSSWQKSRHFPYLYRAMGGAYQQRKQLFSAVYYADQYARIVRKMYKTKEQISQELLKATREGDREKSRLLGTQIDQLNARLPQDLQSFQKQLGIFDTWKRALAERSHQAKQQMKRLQRQLRAKRYAQAYETYRQIRELIPSHPMLLSQLSEMLRKTFPGISGTINQTILRQLELPPRMKTPLEQRQEQLQQHTDAKKKALGDLLKQTDALLAKQQQPQALRRLKRELDSLQHLSQSALHSQFLKWLQTHRKRDLTNAIALWRLYLEKVRQLRQKGLIPWIQSQMQEGIAEPIIKEQIAVLSALRKVQESTKRIQSLLQSGQLAASAQQLARLETLWTALKTSDKWEYKQEQEEKVKRLLALSSSLQKAHLYQRKAEQFNQRAEFSRAREYQQKVTALLRGTSAARWWSTRNQRYNRRSQQAINAQFRGYQLLRTGRQWKAAEKHFAAYLTAFPNAYNAKDIKQKIKLCKCGYHGVPWEDCSKEKEMIRRIKRKHR